MQTTRKKTGLRPRKNDHALSTMSVKAPEEISVRKELKYKKVRGQTETTIVPSKKKRPKSSKKGYQSGSVFTSLVGMRYTTPGK